MLINDGSKNNDLDMMADVAGSEAAPAPAPTPGNEQAPDPRSAGGEREVIPDENDLDYEELTEGAEGVVEGEEEVIEETAEEEVVEETTQSNLQQQIAELRALINQQAQDKQVQQQPVKKAVLDANKYLLTKEELDTVIDDPTIFNQKIAAMVADFTAYVAESNMTPTTVQSIAEGVMYIQEKTRTFYQDNKDLDTPDRRNLVQLVMREKHNAAQTSGRPIDIDTLLRETEKDVRKALGIKKSVKPVKTVVVPSKGKEAAAPGSAKPAIRPNAKPAGKTPTLPGAKGSARPAAGADKSSKPRTQQDLMFSLVQ